MNLEQFAKSAETLRVLGVVVTQDGKEIAKQVWDEECRRNVYSASKSFTSCAVGMAMKEGLLSLDEKLVDCFPDELPEQVSDNLKKATVRDLLTMHLGQAKASLMGGQRPYYEEDDWVKMSLAIPFVEEPNTKFVYNNVGPYLAGILVQRRCGCDLVSYLTPRLFAPLGIKAPLWETDRQGNTFGAGGLMLTLSELHKFGCLYLQNGAWEGKQLVPEKWVQESTKKQGENDRDSFGWLSVLGRPGRDIPRRRQVFPAFYHLQGEKCGHYRYCRMQRRRSTDAAHLYGHLSSAVRENCRRTSGRSDEENGRKETI